VNSESLASRAGFLKGDLMKTVHGEKINSIYSSIEKLKE